MKLENIPEQTGPYRKIKCCKSCDWFPHPDSYIDKWALCCPLCGEGIGDFVGRYKYKYRKGTFFRVEKIIITGFIKKEDE